MKVCDDQVTAVTVSSMRNPGRKIEFSGKEVVQTQAGSVRLYGRDNNAVNWGTEKAANDSYVRINLKCYNIRNACWNDFMPKIRADITSCSTPNYYGRCSKTKYYNSYFSKVMRNTLKLTL